MVIYMDSNVSSHPILYNKKPWYFLHEIIGGRIGVIFVYHFVLRKTDFEGTGEGGLFFSFF